MRSQGSHLSTSGSHNRSSTNWSPLSRRDSQREKEVQKYEPWAQDRVREILADDTLRGSRAALLKQFRKRRGGQRRKVLSMSVTRPRRRA